MTIFKQAILTGALRPEHLARGIWLDEDDHGLTLVVKGVEVAHWGIYARIEEIRQLADKYI